MTAGDGSVVSLVSVRGPGLSACRQVTRALRNFHSYFVSFGTLVVLFLHASSSCFVSLAHCRMLQF